MAGVIYMLCALTALACAVLLLRSYREHHHRLLLWSGLCFAGLFLHNLFLVIDKLFFPEFGLSTWRMLVALIALLPLLYGLIWEDE